MKYIDADLLKSKLKDVATECKTGNYYLDNSEQAVGYENALIDFEEIIDSLQQEQPEMDLEEEVKRYYSDNFAYISSDQPTLSILTNIARHFAEWGAEHLRDSTKMIDIEDVEKLHTFLYAIKNNKQGVFTFTRLSDEQYKEVLRRFKAIKEEKI